MEKSRIATLKESFSAFLISFLIWGAVLIAWKIILPTFQAFTTNLNDGLNSWSSLALHFFLTFGLVLEGIVTNWLLLTGLRLYYRLIIPPTH